IFLWQFPACLTNIIPVQCSSEIKSGCGMGEYFVELAGTPEGERLALVLALVSAFAHAVFAALNKGGKTVNNPYLNRGIINVFYSLMAAPFALFVFPLPSGFLIWVLAASFLLHLAYEWLQSAAFSKGAFTLTYPIARGTGPLMIAILAIIVFAENLSAGQWVGMILLSGAIISLARINIKEVQLSPVVQSNLIPSILLAIGAGIFIALYTTVDAYGIRLAENPFMFLSWFFFLGGFGFPVVAFVHWKGLPEKPPVKPLVVRGLVGAFVAYFSFATLMLATRIGNVSEAAALRETSIIFATLIGIFLFREKVSTAKLFVIALIALGAVLIEFG
ncbi:MAG: DMT family transporter, partial [Pseudomonadota bacterium]